MEIIHSRNSKELARAIATELSLAVFPANVRRFNNDEISVSVPKYFPHALVIASTVTNEDWIELFLLLNALRDSKEIILCMPYMGYSRQDLQNPNESFGASLFSRLLEEVATISHCIIVDNHCEPFLRIPTIHISAENVFVADIMRKYAPNPNKIVVISPDIGGSYRANSVAKAIGCDFAICNKVKDVFGELKKTIVIGDVEDKICILIDDIIDSGSTLCYASRSLIQAKCKGVVAYSTHGVLSKGALAKLEESGISEITLTDSIHHSEKFSAKFRKLSIVSLIVESIRCIL